MQEQKITKLVVLSRHQSSPDPTRQMYHSLGAGHVVGNAHEDQRPWVLTITAILSPLLFTHTRNLHPVVQV